MVLTAPFATAVHSRMTRNRTPLDEIMDRLAATVERVMFHAHTSTLPHRGRSTHPHRESCDMPPTGNDAREGRGDRLVLGPGMAVIDDCLPDAPGTQPGPVYLARVPGGPPRVLAGSAALIWRCAVNSVQAEVALRVTESIGRDEQSIRHSVDDFVQHLVDERFLTGSATSRASS